MIAVSLSIESSSRSEEGSGGQQMSPELQKYFQWNPHNAGAYPGHYGMYEWHLLLTILARMGTYVGYNYMFV